VTVVADDVMDLVRFGLYPVRLHYPIFRGNSVHCSCGKPKCEGSIGKHPFASAWGKSATQDEEIIREQWQESGWNVGIVLGPCHGIPADMAVVDIEDDKPEGREFADMILAGYPAPTYSSGKSLHRIYRWTPDLPETGKANLTINGLEFRFGGRGKETQSVAPPSIHQNGSQYQWLPGMSPDDIPIIELPKHVIELACKHWAQEAGGGSSSGSSTTDARKFRSKQGKIGVGARHHSLLIEANHLWRLAFNNWGINGIEEDEVYQQLWMMLQGLNLLVCDPPKSESEVDVILKSAYGYMREQLLQEIEAKLAMALPTPPESDEEEDNTAWDRSFGSYLHKHGIRLVSDPTLDPTEQDSDRIDEWSCGWSMRYVTKGDEDLVVVTVGEIEISMNSMEFQAASSFARKVQQHTEMILAQTFTQWDWRTIWEGRPNDKKKQNGITRGLREFLTSKAIVEEKTENGINDQIEDIILAMIGNKDELMSELQLYQEHGHKFCGRLKVVPGGGLTTMKDKDDTMTGYYYDGEAVWLLVRVDEVSRKHRAAFGGTINSRQIVETLESLGFERKQFRRGPLSGRWHSRQEKNTE